MRDPDGSRQDTTALPSVIIFAIMTTDRRDKQLAICQTNYTATVTKIAITTTGRKQLVVSCLSKKNKLHLCVPPSPLGIHRDFHVSALCVDDPSHHSKHHQSTKRRLM